MTNAGNGCLGVFGFVGLLMSGLLGFLLLPVGSSVMLPPAVVEEAEAVLIPPASQASLEIVLAAVQDDTGADDDLSAVMPGVYEVVQQRLQILVENGVITAYSTELTPDNQIIIRLQEEETPADDVIPVLTAAGHLEFVDFALVDREAFATYVGTVINTTGHSDHVDDDEAQTVFPTILTYEDIARVTAETDDLGNAILQIELTADGAARFSEFSEVNIGNGLAVVLDGTVLTVPVIQSRLESPVILTGLFDDAEVRLLAARLNSRPLPLLLRVDSLTEVVQP